jgi:mercuric ion transport protein
MKTDKKLIGTSILTSIAASLCCIPPILALIAGTSGIASSFSWIEPFRPYLIAITLVVLVFAWYQKLKPAKIDCDCPSDEKVKFLQSKLFLALVSVFALVMLALPYYSKFFYPSDKNASEIDISTNTVSMEFMISGMTCTSCEVHVSHKVSKLEGVFSTNVSYKNGNARIEYDPRLTNEMEIKKAIAATGYKVIDKKQH